MIPQRIVRGRGIKGGEVPAPGVMPTVRGYVYTHLYGVTWERRRRDGEGRRGPYRPAPGDDASRSGDMCTVY